MFIATANTLSTVHPALRDRMEVIELPGYLLEEKGTDRNPAPGPKQMAEHGLKMNQMIFSTGFPAGYHRRLHP